MSKCIAIIPARYDSSRFPGKALADIGGRSMIGRVYEQLRKCTEVDRIIIATDDERIKEHMEALGADVEMTFRSHKSGTDRCAQVGQQFWSDAIILNIQGDEPFIDPKLIDRMARKMKEDDWMSLLTAKKLILENGEREDPGVVKVVCDKMNKALYFSRASIPFLRENDGSSAKYFKHLGVYAYRNKTLQEITALGDSELENAEMLEQLRWLEYGYTIHVLETESDSFGIDTPEDLEKAKAYF